MTQDGTILSGQLSGGRVCSEVQLRLVMIAVSTNPTTKPKPAPQTSFTILLSHLCSLERVIFGNVIILPVHERAYLFVCHEIMLVLDPLNPKREEQGQREEYDE